MVRIGVQLVRAADGFGAWSGRFDRKLDDIFTVQDDIAGMIAQTLTQRVSKTTGPLRTASRIMTDTPRASHAQFANDVCDDVCTTKGVGTAENGGTISISPLEGCNAITRAAARRASPSLTALAGALTP